jgi:adenylate cyclase
LIRRLDEATAQEFPILAELCAEGLTHYVMAPLFFSEGVVNAASWASDAPEGFSAANIALLRAITPVFTLLIESVAVRRMSAELMATYLGRTTAARVLAGEIQRGHMQRISAAIFVCDLRGFTQYSNTHDEAQVIDRLNRYFDAVAAPIDASGGEILKFQGDGVMAIFRDRSEEAARSSNSGEACRRALAAARGALAAIDDANAAADARPDPPFAVGIALHYGVIAYGNIGARDRLDFTVVGHDVNLAYRIERQCAALGHRLVLSARLAQAVAPVRSLGVFPLRGFATPQELFTTDEPAIEAPALQHADRF